VELSVGQEVLSSGWRWSHRLALLLTGPSHSSSVAGWGCQDRMIRIGQDVEGSGRGPFWSSVAALAWRNWQEPPKMSARTSGRYLSPAHPDCPPTAKCSQTLSSARLNDVTTNLHFFSNHTSIPLRSILYVILLLNISPVRHSGHYMYRQFNTHKSYVLPTQCYVRIWEQTAIISLYSINWLVFITETKIVYCAVRTGSLCVLCGSKNKQRLFPYTALTDWFL